MKKPRPVYADAMAFLGFPMEPPRVEEGLQLDVAHVTCAPPVGPCVESLSKTIAACEEFKAAVTKSGKARIVTNESGFDLASGQTNIILGLQNLPGDLNPKINLEFAQLCVAGIRVLSLAYDKANKFGNGCLNIDGGLGYGGELVLAQMQDFGFILDLSHASHRMAREALEFMDKKNLSIPVMASHGGCYAVYPHFRNLPDDVLAGIAKRGGVVGIANLTFILHQSDNTAQSFWEHYSHAKKVCGADAVVIGSDAPYTTYMADAEKEMFGKMKNIIDPNGTWGARYPMYTPELAGPSKMELVDLKCEPGEGILGRNLLNFFTRSLPA